jgi:hypothetical protein
MLMRSGFDIGTIHGDGYLVLPLSMSRLAKSQTPDWCYRVFQYFLPKLDTYGNDVVLLYTNGLYLNSDRSSFEMRKKLIQQALNHTVALRALIRRGREFIPGAFHFLPIDYVILNSSYFEGCRDALNLLANSDSGFQKAVAKDMIGRGNTAANVSFVLEEIVVTHILRQQLVELPRTLVKNDTWRLIVYEGGYINGDLYQWRKHILPHQESQNPFGGAHYDFSRKTLTLFDEIRPRN